MNKTQLSQKTKSSITRKEQDTKGITAKKADDFSEWYTQIITKGELIEYGPVSGCYILRPAAYAIWEKVQQFLDKLIKDDGVRNAYFPLLIPESLLTKEKKHVAGFKAEVAWVETGGHSKLPERLAVRPTSETIMYDAYSKWIRSHKDLPLRLNQWNNVVRWEFQHPVPFLRSREFLWQEGHTVFASKEEAVQEARKILGFYERLFRELYALPVLSGRKADSEKFAGADFSLSLEVVLPNGKAAQGATSHHLGQNFSKAFGITFLDEKQQQQFGWQNSWGISTRSIGLMVMAHSDDKGLVLPPRVAPLQVVIVPILFDDSKAKVLKEANNLRDTLTKTGLSIYLDDRDGYTPGWKFNEWEVKGVPVRIELGPKDLQKKQVMVVRRDTGEKKAIPLAEVEKRVLALQKEIQENLYRLAEEKMKKSISTISAVTPVTSWKEAEKQITAEITAEITAGKVLFVPWCADEKCEEAVKEKTGGAKSLNAPFPQQQPALKQGQPRPRCFACAKPAKEWFYFGKSY